MPLVIETGTGSNASANSYASAQDLRDHAEAMSIDLTGLSNAQLESKLLEAMLRLSSYRDRWKGQRTSASQPLDWPRSDVWDVHFPEALTPSDEIPEELINGQIQLAIDALSQSLFQQWGEQPERMLTTVKVGPITEVYSGTPQEKNFTEASESALIHLRPLLNKNGLYLTRS